MRQEGKTVAIYLYPQDIAIVQAADKSSAGVSATLRRIIREWNDDRHQRGAPPLVDPMTDVKELVADA
jgi:hypothetical protein